MAGIPVDDLACITDEEQRREARWQLFHKCMEAILEPIQAVSRQGEEMRCADGGVRRVHPILAAFMGDYPEQCLVTCARDGRCPICLVPRNKKVGDYEQGHLGTIDALGIRPTRPFWRNMPFVDIFGCITPDLLHQVDKGVFGDHLVKWCRFLIGEDELDRRLIGMPRYSGIRHSDNRLWEARGRQGGTRYFGLHVPRASAGDVKRGSGQHGERLRYIS